METSWSQASAFANLGCWLVSIAKDWSEWFMVPFNIMAALAILLSNFECSPLAEWRKTLRKTQQMADSGKQMMDLFFFR